MRPAPQRQQAYAAGVRHLDAVGDVLGEEQPLHPGRVGLPFGQQRAQVVPDLGQFVP
jgi:hypothetical protein